MGARTLIHLAQMLAVIDDSRIDGEMSSEFLMAKPSAQFANRRGQFRLNQGSPVAPAAPIIPDRKSYLGRQSCSQARLCQIL